MRDKRAVGDRFIAATAVIASAMVFCEAGEVGEIGKVKVKTIEAGEIGKASEIKMKTIEVSIE